MRSKLPLIVVVALVILAAVATRYAWERRAQQKREAAYQSLHSYSQVLRLGMTRKELEDHLRTKGVPGCLLRSDRLNGR